MFTCPEWLENVLFVVFVLFIIVAAVAVFLIIVSACLLMARCIREDFNELRNERKNKKGGK